MGNRFSLQQFSPLFQLRNPAGHHYIIIGGQAVNYWAERYLEAEPELQKHAPFTSEDIDFCGNRDDVLFIASQLKLVPAFPPKVAMTALAGFIPIPVSYTHLSTGSSNVGKAVAAPTPLTTSEPGWQR